MREELEAESYDWGSKQVFRAELAKGIIGSGVRPDPVLQQVFTNHNPCFRSGGKLKFRKVAREEFQGERSDWEVSKSLRGEPAKGKLAHVSGPDQCISKQLLISTRVSGFWMTRVLKWDY